MGGALALSRVDRQLGIAGRQVGRRPVGRGLRPGVALVLVSAALVVNQALVLVYIDRVHDGDVTFVSRWLPDGWFELPHSGALVDRTSTQSEARRSEEPAPGGLPAGVSDPG